MQPHSQWHSLANWRAGVLVAVLVLGTGFRFSNLDRRAYWHDEAYTSLRAAGYHGGEVFRRVSSLPYVDAAQLMEFQSRTPEKSLRDSIESLARSDPHIPPLYILMSRYWMSLVGDSPEAMRSLAAVIGMMALIGCYWLGLELFRSRLSALLALVLMCVSPIHVLLAREARPYSLWTLAVLVSSAAFLRALRIDDRRAWALYSGTVIMGLYSHLFFSLLLPVHAIYLMLLRFETNGERSQKRQMVSYVFATGFAVLCFTPWIWVIIRYFPKLRASTAWTSAEMTFMKTLQIWFDRFGAVFFDWVPPRYELRALIVLPLFGLMLYGFYFVGKHRSWHTMLFLVLLTSSSWALLAVTDLALGGMRSSVARYLVPSYVGLLFPVAYLLATKLRDPRMSHRVAWGLATLALVWISATSDYALARAEGWWDKGADHRVREMLRAINHAPQPVVVFTGDRGTDLGYMLSLAHELDSHVHLRWGTDAISTAREDYSDVFLFDPPAEFRKRFSGNELQAVVEPMLWRLNNPQNRD